MQKKYNINFDIPENYPFDLFEETLINEYNSDGIPAFEVKMTKEGFYFCDNCWSIKSSIALRNTIDLALVDSKKVEVSLIYKS
ncbi:MAG: hypothetical protein KKF30_12550 [Proteobacteria bacterium]|nr:hypothetical protein [Pseudomonadota bacterium]MBU4472409.1 hypothetical protein [Pseudomonadota bacterium]MCG2751006.1 hypothetical protein [Desulfobacteraceae bacterium]